MGTLLLGPASLHEEEETGPSPRSLRYDWAYKPGGEGVARKQVKESTGNVREGDNKEATTKKVKQIRKKEQWRI